MHFLFLKSVIDQFDRSGFYGSFSRYDRVIIWISYSRMKKKNTSIILFRSPNYMQFGAVVDIYMAKM